MTDNNFRVEYQIDKCLPADYQQDIATRAKENLLSTLSGYLWEHREQRTCVFIKEKVDKFGYSEHHEITCQLVAVQEYPIKIVMPTFEDMDWKQLSRSAIDELKRRISEWARGKK